MNGFDVLFEFNAYTH